MNTNKRLSFKKEKQQENTIKKKKNIKNISSKVNWNY